jgi:cytosine/adenosine deaminase-related metal-dependent hydrolase
MQALHAATGSAAQILGADHELGTIEVGKWADLVFLDADPLSDIRNTRRIWNVMRNGEIREQGPAKAVATAAARARTGQWTSSSAHEQENDPARDPKTRFQVNAP